MGFLPIVSAYEAVGATTYLSREKIIVSSRGEVLSLTEGLLMGAPLVIRNSLTPRAQTVRMDLSI